MIRGDHYYVRNVKKYTLLCEEWPNVNTTVWENTKGNLRGIGDSKRWSLLYESLLLSKRWLNLITVVFFRINYRHAWFRTIITSLYFSPKKMMRFCLCHKNFEIGQLLLYKFHTRFKIVLSLNSAQWQHIQLDLNSFRSPIPGLFGFRILALFYGEWDFANMWRTSIQNNQPDDLKTLNRK